TLPLYWFGKTQRKAETAKRIRAGTSRCGSAVLPGGTSDLPRKARLTSAPSFRSQRKTVKSRSISWVGRRPGSAGRRSALRELALDRLHERGRVGCGVGREAADDAAAAVDEELLEVPEHLRRARRRHLVAPQLLLHRVAILGPGLRRDQVAIERVLPG